MNEYCIIGGSGFLGGYIVDELVKLNKNVLVVGRSKKSPLKASTKVKYFSADYSDTKKILPLIKKAKYLICLAYNSNPLTSYNNPVLDLQNNVVPMLNLLGSLHKTNIKKVIYISSGGAVYGQSKDLPIKEDHLTHPISPYGITKLTIEKYALLFHKAKNIPVIIIRPGNAYGPNQSPFRGQGFVAVAINKILTNKTIEIFGKDGNTRDYLHASDMAKGIVAAIEKGQIGQVYNLGSGIGLTNREIIKFLAPLAKKDGLKIKVKVLPKRVFDVSINYLDSTKLKRDTKWKPSISLEEGIESTWNWYKNNRNLFISNK